MSHSSPDLSGEPTGVSKIILFSLFFKCMKYKFSMSFKGGWVGLQWWSLSTLLEYCGFLCMRDGHSGSKPPFPISNIKVTYSIEGKFLFHQLLNSTQSEAPAWAGWQWTSNQCNAPSHTIGRLLKYDRFVYGQSCLNNNNCNIDMALKFTQFGSVLWNGHTASYLILNGHAASCLVLNGNAASLGT